MNFRPELAEAVMAGRKWTTFRLASENPNSPYHVTRAPQVKGKRIAICPGRGKVRLGTARVANVSRENLVPRDVGHATARAEGFSSPQDFREVWERIHGNLDPVDVWRFEFADVEVSE